jgi:hypothetical protein
MNFKGTQTIGDKSDKFTKNLSLLDLHKCESSWAHLYAQKEVSIQVLISVDLEIKKRV